MKTMKKLVAALLVLTMVLALTGAAFAETVSNKICVGDYVKFTKNGYAYDAPRASKKISGPEVIVRKGSVAKVLAKKGSYVFLQLTPGYFDKDLGNTLEVDTGVWAWGFWFKTSVLGNTKSTSILVTFSNGGVGKSKAVQVYNDTGDITLDWLKKNLDEEDYYIALAVMDDIRLSDDCKKHVEAKAKVWMHKTPSLSNNYGKALHKGDKVKYRRVWGRDTREVIFYGIRYSGKCLWVSAAYTKIVK